MSRKSLGMDPIFEFRIDYPEDIVTMAGFPTTYGSRTYADFVAVLRR